MHDFRISLFTKFTLSCPGQCDVQQRSETWFRLRDWFPGRQDSAHRLPSSSCNFMPIRHPQKITLISQRDLGNSLQTVLQSAIGGGREMLSKLVFCEQLQLCFLCSGGTLHTHTHKTLGMLKVYTQSNLKKWWELSSTDITFVSGNL